MSRIRRLPDHLINKIAAGVVNLGGRLRPPSEASPQECAGEARARSGENEERG